MTRQKASRMTDRPLDGLARLLNSVAAVCEGEEPRHPQSANILRHVASTMDAVPVEVIGKLAMATEHAGAAELARLSLLLAIAITSNDAADVPSVLDAEIFIETLVSISEAAMRAGEVVH